MPTPKDRLIARTEAAREAVRHEEAKIQAEIEARKEKRLAAAAARRLENARQKKFDKAAQRLLRQCVSAVIAGESEVALDQSEISFDQDVARKLGFVVRTAPWLSEKQTRLITTWNLNVGELAQLTRELRELGNQKVASAVEFPDMPSLFAAATADSEDINRRLADIDATSQAILDDALGKLRSIERTVSDAADRIQCLSIGPFTRTMRLRYGLSLGKPLTEELIERYLARQADFEEIYKSAVSRVGGFANAGTATKEALAAKVLKSLGFDISAPRAFFSVVDEFRSRPTLLENVQQQYDMAKANHPKAESFFRKASYFQRNIPRLIKKLQECLKAAKGAGFEKLSRKDSGHLSSTGDVLWLCWMTPPGKIDRNSSQELVFLRWLNGKRGRAVRAQIDEFLGSQADKGARKAVFQVQVDDASVSFCLGDSDQPLKIPCDLDTAVLFFEQMEFIVTCAARRSGKFALSVGW